MTSSENSTEEYRRLRRTMRDMVALSTLPAVWIGLGPAGIARSLADALLNTLSLEVVFVRLQGRSGDGMVEVLRSRRSSQGNLQVVRESLEPLLDDDQSASATTIPDPFGGDPLRVAMLRFGVSDDQGVLIAGSRSDDFPTEQDRLLFGVGADQTAIVVQRRRVEEQVHEQREWLRVTLASIGDAVIATDTLGRITFLNAVAQDLTGWSTDDAHGKSLEDVFHILHEQTRTPVENPVEKVLREGAVVGLGNHTVLISKDGTERPIDDSAAPIRDATGKLIGVVLIFRAVTEQRRAEQQRNARLAVTHALNQATTVKEGASGVLQAVCDNLSWDVGFFWIVNEEDTSLNCMKSWRRHGVDGEEFETESCRQLFAQGEGLPGRVWLSGESAWVLDIAENSGFVRLDSAVRYGLHSAIACPVIVGGRTLGVIEFFTKRIREPDADLLEMMGTIAGMLGQFIERKTADEELRQSEAELADFFENATVGLHWVGSNGIVLRANQAELDLLGFGRDEYIGHPIADFHADQEVICDILKRLQAGERLTDYPARLRCKDGSIKEVLIDSSVLWKNGQFGHTRCFTRDVTERKRAEAKAQEQEQRTRFILESITDAFFGLDKDWRFTYVNRQAEVLLNRSREELIGKSHWEVYADTLGTQVESGYRRALADNVTETFENFYPPHDRWYEVRAYPSSEGLSVYFQDVSERKRAELALRESEQRFRQLADSMPQIVWAARPDGQIDYLNQRWKEFTGLPDTVGNDGWAQILHEDDSGPARERWEESLAHGTRFEMEVRLRDRREQSYRWHLIRTEAIKDEAGNVIRWFGTSTDIHQQKRAEESSRYLAEASSALAGVVDYESTLQKVANLAVPYFADWSALDVANEDGTLRRLAVAHQEADKIALVHKLMEEYPPDPQSPTGAVAVLRSGRPEMIAEITDEMLVQGAKDERHLQLIRSLGLKSFICVPLVVSGNSLGALTFATAESGRRYSDSDLALAMDLANRAAVAIENTQLYQSLRDNDRRKDEFLATLAHELRNPLAPVRNSLQILKMARVDEEMVQQCRNVMERQVDHLVRLVDDLLDVSRVMRGKIELRRESVELATVVARAVETVQPLVDAQGHHLNVRLSSESLLLNADPMRLSQVVGNLLTNAAKYTEPNGHIWLSAERDDENVVLRVRDDGIGIDPVMLPRIFELFVQVDHAATRSQGGLGIGLTLVKNLVEMHNGTVEAHSSGLGKGCEFIVRLPLVIQAKAPDQDRKTPLQAQPPTCSGHRLLVVDDNQDAANSLAMLLRLQGHEVQVAFSGPAALEITKSYQPDVVFMDIGMPGMDGYEVARRMREYFGLNNVVLVALTGWGQQEDRRRTAEAGFNHHLVKPPEPKAVEGILAALPRRQSSEE